MMSKAYKIEAFDSLVSTNDKMKTMANNQKLDDGTVILAYEQTSGKGQRGRQWISEKGQNLLFSLFYRPDNMKAVDQFRLTQVISISVCSVIIRHIPKKEFKLSIKWPNDIYVNDRKLGGILIENAILGQNIQHSIIGVGININQINFPKYLPNPASLFNLTGIKQDINKILMEILDEFYIISKKDQKSLVETYTKNLYCLNEQRDFMLKGKKSKAKIKGVDNMGRLVLETDHETGCYNHESVDFLL